MRCCHLIFRLFGLASLWCLAGYPVHAADFWPFILPEQTAIEIRDPPDLPRFPVASTPRPPTVSDPQFDLPPRNLSLNEAISTGLANSEVVRVLAGVTAVSSGRTIYDVPIANTQIDQQQAQFDPSAQVLNGWNRTEPPSAFFDPFDPARAIIGGTRTDTHNFDFGLTKRTATGGVVDFGVNSGVNRFRPGVFPFNPQNRSSADLSFTQPLLQGGGIAVNRIPIVLARIDTERSFFQYKSSVQQHVGGIIAAYWSLVSARTDLWAREKQVAQAEFANARTASRLSVGDANAGDVAQTRVALENFRVALLNAQANVLQREAALRNILGFPPFDPDRIVPVSPPVQERIELDWQGIVDLAEQFRPDIIELKLVLEADEQLLVQSENQASPAVDAVALYRWNGLEGTMPGGADLSSRPGQFTDWTLGVNFSVPLGLRRERAALRQRELVISRDRANLQQGVHQMVHELALNLRNLDLLYEQYKRFKALRTAASMNLDQQMAAYGIGRIQFIIALQAIVDWGNAVSSEAQSITQYNTALADLEIATGTILESHGVAFYEERFGSLGPLGRFAQNRCYPFTLPATPTVDRYNEGELPSEQSFDLRDPMEDHEERRDRLSLPPPLPLAPLPLDGAARFQRLPEALPAGN